MGSELCCAQETIQHNAVSHLPSQLPNDKRYHLFRGKTNRYNDLSVLNIDSNVYLFNLKTDPRKQIQVKLAVLNEIAHRVVHVNYKLKINKNIVMDPMDESYENTLILVKNQTTGIEYHMRTVPFIGYNSNTFKKALEQVWIYQNKISKQDKHLFLTLQDAFIYGVNPDQQALVMLFDKIDGDLFHIGQYRREANWPWKEEQKIKIIQNLFQSILRMKELNLLHRNISPSNLFLVQKINRYVIGNFSTGRQLFYSDESDLVTVYGAETLSQGKVVDLISQKADMGIFSINEAVYSNIKVVIEYIESLSITNRNPTFKSAILECIYSKVKRHASIQDILKYLKDVETERHYKGINLSEDKIIRSMNESLLYDKYKTRAEEYMFKTYQILGYYKQFSDMAHSSIEKNNIEETPYKNAYIFKDLGFFYEKNGTGGTQYLLNACILFCKQTDKYIQYKLYGKAAENIAQAEDLYVQLSNISDFSLNLIEINRLRALLKVYYFTNMDEASEKNEAIQLINKTMNLAGEKNLPIQKQMKLLLTWGVINRQSKNSTLAEERFRNGLSICDNTGAFENVSSCLLMKSNFLYELGILYLQKMNQMHNPQRASVSQSYLSYGYKQKCEQNLKYALDIREKEQSNPFHIAQCHYSLGDYYLLLNNFIQAKNQYKKCLIKMKLLKEEVSPSLIVKMNYDLGSAFYRLKEYDSAQFYYKQAISILQQTQYDNDWKVTIQGNLALVKISSGERSQGFQELQNVKEIIRNSQGTESYDYLFLVTQEEKIREDLY